MMILNFYKITFFFLIDQSDKKYIYILPLQSIHNCLRLYSWITSCIKYFIKDICTREQYFTWSQHFLLKAEISVQRSRSLCTCNLCNLMLIPQWTKYLCNQYYLCQQQLYAFKSKIQNITLTFLLTWNT